MPNNFTYTLDNIAQKVNNKNHKNDTKEFLFALDNAVIFWCKELDFDYNIISYISKGYKRAEMGNLISYFWKESNTLTKESEIPSLCGKITIENPLYKQIKKLLNLMNLNFDTNSIKFIVLIAFVITAVGYLVYKLNYSLKEQEKPTRKINNKPSEASSQISFSIPNTPPQPKQPLQPSPKISDPISTTPPPPEKPLLKYLLVLVVPASNKLLIDSLKTEEKINKENSAELYEATQYLRQDTEDELSPKLANLNEFQATKVSEYDIFLITIELNQADERFEPNVNQLDRLDAFRNLYLADAKVKEISPPLQMQAYGNLDVYKR